MQWSIRDYSIYTADDQLLISNFNELLTCWTFWCFKLNCFPITWRDPTYDYGLLSSILFFQANYYVLLHSKKLSCVLNVFWQNYLKFPTIMVPLLILVAMASFTLSVRIWTTKGWVQSGGDEKKSQKLLLTLSAGIFA